MRIHLQDLNTCITQIQNNITKQHYKTILQNNITIQHYKTTLQSSKQYNLHNKHLFKYLKLRTQLSSRVPLVVNHTINTVYESDVTPKTTLSTMVQITHKPKSKGTCLRILDKDYTAFHIVSMNFLLMKNKTDDTSIHFKSWSV